MQETEKCQEMDCRGAPGGSEGHRREASASVSRMARGGVGTETSPRQSLLMLKVGVARSEAGAIAGTRYGLS